MVNFTKFMSNEARFSHTPHKSKTTTRQETNGMHLCFQLKQQTYFTTLIPGHSLC